MDLLFLWIEGDPGEASCGEAEVGPLVQYTVGANSEAGYSRYGSKVGAACDGCGRETRIREGVLDGA